MAHPLPPVCDLSRLKRYRMNIRLALLFCLSCTGLFAPKKPAPAAWRIAPPAENEYCRIDPAGKTVLPNGRYLTPRGRQILTAPHPYGLALSADGSVAVTANSGIEPFSITIVRNPFGPKPEVVQIPDGPASDEGVLEACFMGLAISPDNTTVFVAGGEANKVFLFDLKTGKPAGQINCATTDGDRDYTHGYLGDMALTRDGKTLFVLDQIGFRLIEIDVAARKIRHNIPTGRYPFGICLSPDERRLFVANVGVFEYKPFTDYDPKNPKTTGHPWPETSYNTPEMRDGIPTKNVPPLGDPNDPAAFSVWAFDRAAGAKPTVRAKIKTGFLVGQMVEDFPAVGGSSPNSLAATDDFVFVSNGNNDCVSVISLARDTVVGTIFMQPDARLGTLRGIIPFGLAVSPDQKRLFVAESGINAVAVVDIESMDVLGHLPTGWFPSKVRVSPDGQNLLVTNAKGFGSGPNGGAAFVLGQAGSYIGNLMRGTLGIAPLPPEGGVFEGVSVADFWKKETQAVLDNNFRFVENRPGASGKNPIPAFAGEKVSPIKHVVFIAKENRTYDEVFGQMPGGKGDAALARYGAKASFATKKGKKPLENVDVMPNHLALARRFAMCDNYYCDSDVSADGHRWMVNTYPNEWCETSTAAAYGGHRGRRESSPAPGNNAFYGAAGSIYPEDYNEAGSLWDHLDRWGVDYFNYGFGVEMAGSWQDSTMKFAGEVYGVNYPLPATLKDKSSRQFPTYNTAIPDQFRTDIFIKEYREKWLAPGKTPPPLLTLMLPQDHGDRERPGAGYPYTESYMADNDLALGRVVEFLSRTPQWKDMAIIVIEDDPQGGVDHVDAHRSLCLVISPWVKRGYIGHKHYSFGSIFKTMWNVFGLPPQNQYDAGALDFGDLFAEKPDLTPFNAVPIDPRLFDPAKALDPFDENFDWKAVQESAPLDKVEDMQKRMKDDDDKRRIKKQVEKSEQKEGGN